jgi:cobalt-zinc-cadmium resistance protein CzcA
LENFQKWEKSWEFYQQKILPNIQKQRAGSLLAYREGALDYFALIQNLDASLSSEFQALESLDQYLHAIFNLQFYTLNP